MESLLHQTHCLEVFINEQEITLDAPDIYADFQTEDAVYHDDTQEYSTNEPTITMNSVGLAFATWFVPPAKE